MILIFLEYTYSYLWKNGNKTNSNRNQTDISNEKNYHKLRQEFGVELSELQKGFDHVIYGNKQLLTNRNLNLNNIYTGIKPKLWCHQ